jgi:hypothetical protein
MAAFHTDGSWQVRKGLLIAAAVAILVVVALRLLHVPRLARIGAGYVAEQTCACLFISRRSPESCHLDLEPLARRVVRVRVSDGEVTARSFVLARATARYTRGLGCTLVD